MRGPRGDPVSHALGLSRGHTEARAEHRFTGPAMQPYWCLGLSPPTFLWKLPRALNIQGRASVHIPSEARSLVGPIQRRRICKWGQPWSTVWSSADSSDPYQCVTISGHQDSLPLLEQVLGGAHVVSTSAFMGSFLPRVKLDHKVTKEEKDPSAYIEIR